LGQGVSSHEMKFGHLAERNGKPAGTIVASR
jgi:hypothetical protein